MARATLDDIVARCDAWEESKHPRDGDGQFATTASSSPKSAKLTPTEKSYLSSYSGDDFLRVNKKLRAGGSKDDQAVKRIDKAMEKSSLPASTVYRGMTRDAARHLFPGGEIKKGETISDKAFLSTSKSYSVAHARGFGGVVLKIEVSEGAKGVDMEGIARDKSESEVLLPRDAKLVVEGVTPGKKPGDPVIVRAKYA